MTLDFHTFKAGDPVNWSLGSDTHPGTVVRLTKTLIFVRSVETKLLNGANSEAPDALHFSPGGFVGHTSGEQRYEFGEMQGGEIAFSRRAAKISVKHDDGERHTKDGFIAKMRGSSMRGSMAPHQVLRHGHEKHYDFNF